MESGKKMSGNETDSMEKQRPRIRVYMYIYIAASNFYDFHARAPAHLEIRFNSLNFKKLPPLPRRSALHPSSEFLLLFLPIRLVQPFTPPLRITSTPFSPWNEIAPLCTVQGQLLDRLLLSFRGNTLATTKNQPCGNAGGWPICRLPIRTGWDQKLRNGRNMSLEFRGKLFGGDKRGRGQLKETRIIRVSIF